MNLPAILLLCSRLDLPGGTERAIASMANLFLSKGHRVTLLVLDEAGATTCFYKLDEGIQVLHAPLHFGVTQSGNVISRKTALLKHVRSLRKRVGAIRPDVVIATDYVFAIAGVLARLRQSARLISWEPHHFHWLERNRFWSFLFRKTYPSLDTVVCLNTAEADHYLAMGCRTSVIPGFLQSFPGTKASLDTKMLLTVGWLSKRKGTDLIPAVAETVFDRHPDWQWTIVGSGEESENLKKNLEAQGLSGRFCFIAVTDYGHLQKLYQSASIYVMLSRQEGFPSVLLEAQSHGVPAVAFDCPSGPAAIINHEVDGLLIPPEDTAAMAAGVHNLIDNDEKRKQLGGNAFVNIQRFSAERIYALWKKVLSNVKM